MRSEIVRTLLTPVQQRTLCNCCETFIQHVLNFIQHTCYTAFQKRLCYIRRENWNNCFTNLLKQTKWMLHVCCKAVSDYFGANMLHLRQTCCILSHNLLHCSSNHCAQKTLFNLFSSWNLLQTCCTNVATQLHKVPIWFSTVQNLPTHDAERASGKEAFLSPGTALHTHH